MSNLNNVLLDGSKRTKQPLQTDYHNCPSVCDKASVLLPLATQQVHQVVRQGCRLQAPSIAARIHGFNISYS